MSELKKGKLLVIEGTDGSGKETQSKLLIDRLGKDDLSCKYISFPRYGTPTGDKVSDYLQGKFGDATAIDPYQASCYYADDRAAAKDEMRQWLSEGFIIVANRYTTANKGHQAGKIADICERQKFLRWLDDLEYRINGIPKENLTILLYAPFQIGQRLATERSQNSIENHKLDQHERNPLHLRAAEGAYLYVAKDEGWQIVNCSDDGQTLLPREIIHEHVYDIVKKIL